MEAWGAVESARKLWMHRRYETLWASYPDLEIGAGPRTRRRHGDRAPWLQRGGTGQKTRFLRNEPKCNVEQIAFMWLMENELDRLRKNDKWVRFFRSDRRPRSARTERRGRETGAEPGRDERLAVPSIRLRTGSDCRYSSDRG